MRVLPAKAGLLLLGSIFWLGLPTCNFPGFPFRKYFVSLKECFPLSLGDSLFYFFPTLSTLKIEMLGGNAFIYAYLKLPDS